MNTPPDLYDRILRFPIDEGTPDLSFEARLARENAWSITFARRVVFEYRRFVFLAMTARHQVTPSDQVDQAWHLHLTYSRSYWERMCGELLGRPLHHGPTRGGAAETARFDRQYEQTLAAYRAAFGEEPPADIWPPAATRFGEDLHFIRVNTACNWVVPKGLVKRAAIVGGIGIAAAVCATGCEGIVNPFVLRGTDFLWFFIPLLISAFALLTTMAALALRSSPPRIASRDTSAGSPITLWIITPCPCESTRVSFRLSAASPAMMPAKLATSIVESSITTSAPWSAYVP